MCAAYAQVRHTTKSAAYNNQGTNLKLDPFLSH